MTDRQYPKLLIDAHKMAREEAEAVRASFADELKTISLHFETLESKLTEDREINDKTRTRMERPWYLDVHFWAGLSAIPVLLLTGWLVKFVMNDSAMLRLIHKGMGTEAALVDALAGKSEFRDAIEQSLEQRLDPTAKDLPTAIEASVRGKILEKSLIEKMLSDKIKSYIGVRHLAVLSVGLTKPGQARFGECVSNKWNIDLKPRNDTTNSQGKCLLISDEGKTLTATTVFGSKAGVNLDISLGVSLVQFPVPANKEGTLGPPQDITESYKLYDLADFLVDDTNVVPERQVGRSPVYTISGQSFTFSRYRLRDFRISADDMYNVFSIHSFTISIKRSMPQNTLLNVAVIVAQGAL